MGLSTYTANDISVIIDNASKTVYYYKGNDLKGTKTVSDTQTSLGFRGDKSSRAYFNNISYGTITPIINGSDTIAAGSSRTYAITEAGEISIPHPDFKLGLAEEVAGVTLSNNSVTVADTVATGTKITLNVSMGGGTGAIATKEITVTSDPIDSVEYSLIPSTADKNLVNAKYQSEGGDYKINDKTTVHFGGTTVLSENDGVNLDAAHTGYIAFTPDKDGTITIDGKRRPSSRLYQSTTGTSDGSEIVSASSASASSFTVSDIPVTKDVTYYFYNSNGSSAITSVNKITYKYTREAFDGIKGYVNRATNTYAFQIGNAEAATVKETQVKADENKYVDMTVYLGEGDLHAQGEGIKFAGPTITLNSSDSIAKIGNGRYIVVTPKLDGKLSLATTFTDAGTGNNVARVHYSEIEEDKNPTDYTRSVSNTGINPISSTINMKAGKSYVIFTYNKACTISAISYTYDKTIGIDYENEKFTNIIDGDYTITGEGLEESLPAGIDSAIAIDNSYFVGKVTISGTGDGNVISQALTLTRPAAPVVTADYTVTQPETANEKGTVTAQNDAVLQYSTDGSEWTDVPEEIAQGTTFYLRKAATDSAFASTATEEITIDTIDMPTYTVTWKVEGQEDNVQSLDYGATIEAPQDPTKAADDGHTYTFEGWHITTAEGEKVESFGTVSGDVTYVAVFTSVNKTFNVTYHSDHGTQPEATTYTFGTGIAELPQLTDTNYSFDGWYDGADFTTANEVESISISDFGDKNLYAKWTAKNYTITYNTNGGSAVTEETAAYDTIIPVPNSNPTKSGYEFSGWYTNEQLTTPLADGAKVTGDQTLYAKWTPISYRVAKLSMTNGTVNLSAATATVEDEITVTIVLNTGYKLATLTVGDEDVTNSVSDNSYTFNMPAKNVEVSATFERKTVKSINVTGSTPVTRGRTGSYTAEVIAEDDTDATELYKSEIVWSVTGAAKDAGNSGTTAIDGTDNTATLTLDADETGTDKDGTNYVTVVATIGAVHGDMDVEVTAEQYYNITVDSTITGGSISPAKASEKAGETVTFTVSANAGYTLAADSVKVNNGAVSVSENAGTYSFTMPEGAAEITASFTANAQSITGTITGGSYTVYSLDESNVTTAAATIPTDGKFIIVPSPTAQDSTLTTPVSVSGVAAGAETDVTGAVSGTYIVYTMGATGAEVSGEYTVNTYTVTKAQVSNGSFAVSPESGAAGTEITITPAAGTGYEVDKVYAYATSGGAKTDAGAEISNDSGYKFTLTQNTTVEVTFKKIKAPKTFLNLHEGFSSWLKIEKTNAADSDDVVLTVSNDQESQNDIPTLTAYIAVYNSGVLQSVKKHDFVSNAVTLPASEATGEYKIFIWADQMEPVIEAVTPNTTGANKLFD